MAEHNVAVQQYRRANKPPEPPEPAAKRHRKKRPHAA
jgi:hypothetical protein